MRWTSDDLAQALAQNPDLRLKRPVSFTERPRDAESAPMANRQGEGTKRPRGHSRSRLPDHQRITEDALGELIRTACRTLGTYQFYWLRKTRHSSKGILDLLLIPIAHPTTHDRVIKFIELKGYDVNGRLGKLTPEQWETIRLLTQQGQDASWWAPADWFSGRILEELR